jgi:hypothetical protein
MNGREMARCVHTGEQNVVANSVTQAPAPNALLTCIAASILVG